VDGPGFIRDLRPALLALHQGAARAGSMQEPSCGNTAGGHDADLLRTNRADAVIAGDRQNICLTVSCDGETMQCLGATRGE
jgi:hypothetical protein